jgi:L-iditol 2-dehydrogenase
MTQRPVNEPPRTMLASVLVEPGRIVLEERPVPRLAADEVLVKIASVGVCGSDVHYYREGRIGEFRVEQPLVLGHEAGGVVAAVGSEVDPARVGQRVSIEPQRADLRSPETLAGRYNLDPSMQFYATPPVDGAFAEYASIESHFAHPVPDSVSDDAAALMEPLSVGIAAARKAGLTVGQRVLVTGAGPVGLLLVQVARAYGAAEIVVTDLDPIRRQQAVAFGASYAVDPREHALDSLGVEVFFEASGAVSAIQSGLRALGPAGVAVLVGMGPEEVPVPLHVIQGRELRVTGIFRYANTWPTAIGLVERGVVDLDTLATHHFGLEQVGEALESVSTPGVIKAMVTPGVRSR